MGRSKAGCNPVPLQPAGVGVSIPKEWNADPRTRPETLMPDFEQVLASPIATYDEALAFVRGHGMLNEALLRIGADLERNGIAYAVIGAIALNHHGYKRFTVHIDPLMTKEGLQN